MAKPTIDLDRLLELARAATPGPWRADDDLANNWRVDAPDDADPDCATSVTDDMYKSDAEYIAAVSPDVLTELIERLRAAESRECAIDTSGICEPCGDIPLSGAEEE